LDIGPIKITTRFTKPWSRHTGLPARNAGLHGSSPFSGDNNGANNISGFKSLRRHLKRITPALVINRRPTSNSNIEVGSDSPLFHRLSDELQDVSRAHDHVWEYLCSLPVDRIGVPDYYPHLDKTLRTLEYRNLIYPVNKNTFIHLYPDTDASRDIYVCVEPALVHLSGLMDQVDRRLIDFVEELKEADNGQDKSDVLLKCLDLVCIGNGRFRRRGVLKVTEDELKGLKYLLIRDKVGMGVIEPLILDPYIEDITCSGLGPLFVEHKIFGSLKSDISFSVTEELDRFVIKLSEKIGRPVTLREPIVDAVLPDGSRVNIVYGSDVSKRGSNFTIRKFNATPMSLLDLIDTGTISYEMAAYLSLMIGMGMNTFISGETASGKTTFLNALSTLIPPNSKIVSIEDTAELQVPHPNWTREVVRGNTGEGASVTMFDLLRAAMRQRPNHIIIGEIRGEEGAVAFQAMQTGHACMATFHAASVEKLVQRLTGNPINIPKTYIDNLNLVIIMSAIRLPDGTPARRVLSINEIISYDSETNSYNFIEVFRWNPATDQFEFTGYMNATILETVVAVRRGLTPKNSRQIYDELQDRAIILRKLHERGITNFYELHNVLSQAYRQGLFR